MICFFSSRPSKDKLISATNFILPDKKAIIVLGVTAVHDYETAAVLPAEEHIYQTQLQNEYGQLTLFELINYYRKQANINVYEPQLIEN